MISARRDETLEALRGLAPSRIEAWAWLLQRVSAILLFVFLGVHLGVNHFAPLGWRITYERVTDRLESPLLALEFGLLAAAIYHGLNGVRMVINDFGIGPRARWVTGWVLAIVGGVGFVYGANTLLAFT